MNPNALLTALYTRCLFLQREHAFGRTAFQTLALALAPTVKASPQLNYSNFFPLLLRTAKDLLARQRTVGYKGSLPSPPSTFSSRQRNSAQSHRILFSRSIILLLPPESPPRLVFFLRNIFPPLPHYPSPHFPPLSFSFPVPRVPSSSASRPSGQPKGSQDPVRPDPGGEMTAGGIYERQGAFLVCRSPPPGRSSLTARDTTTWWRACSAPSWPKYPSALSGQ